MEQQTVFTFLQNGNDFVLKKAIKQNWREESFSYLEQPRPDFGLMLLCEGRLEFCCGEHRLFAVEGDIIFLPKHCFYKTNIRIDLGSVSNYLVNFDTVTGDIDTARPTLLCHGTGSAQKEHFKALLREVRASGTDTPAARGLLYLLFDAILHRQEESSADRRVLAQAQALLEKEPPLSIAELARQCCISESSLRRIFRKELGTSPSAYRIGSKLREAEYLLESTDLSIGEIAERLGFFDAAYFCKLFRAKNGLTPKQYKKNKSL